MVFAPPLCYFWCNPSMDGVCEGGELEVAVFSEGLRLRVSQFVNRSAEVGMPVGGIAS
jgi:hypothetical protein